MDFQETGRRDARGKGPAPAWRAEFMRGLRRLAAGEFERASAHFATAHRIAPQQPEVCYALGRERLRQGRLEEAEALLRTAWTGDRSLSVAAGALARCVGGALRRLAEAHAVLDEALAEHPDEPGLLVVRAEMLLEEERTAEARAALERARQMLKQTGRRRERASVGAAAAAAMSRVLNLEGVGLARDGRPDEALFTFKRAADLDPDWSAPIVNMGVAFSQLGRSARALSCYERALAREPGNVVARFNVANLARDRGDATKAAAGYRAVLAADPSYPGARVALAEVLLERDDPDETAEAVALLEAQADEHPDDAHVRAHLGIACERVGDLAGAEAHLRAALAVDEDHVAATCALARLLAGSGRAAEAQSLAARARALDPPRAERYLTPSGL